MTSTIPIPAFIAPQSCHVLPDGAKIGQYASTHVCEEKFDGERVIVCVRRGAGVEAWSKPRAKVGGGKLPPGVKQLGRAVTAALLLLPDGVYDGELLIPKVLPGAPSTGRLTDPERATVKLFDTLELFGECVTTAPCADRRRLLEQAVRHIVPAGMDPWKGSPVSATELLPVTQDTVDRIWARGGEGVILKAKASRYVPGSRSHEWLKVKPVAVAVLEIIGFKAAKTGPYSCLVLQDADGITTSVTTPWNWMKDPASCLGRHLQIEYTQKTSRGSYRHPRADHLVD
jgi:ATP-dependent DNA ligase